jgi:pyruvate-ferredoxin/flavodoxin oxidoreductase
LLKDFTGEADVLFKHAEENAKWRYNTYKRFAEMNFAPAEEVKE